MNKTDKQIDINFGLLRWCGENEAAPERFKLFYGVFLRDMFYLRGNWPDLKQGKHVYFRSVLCREDVVLSAFMPQLFLPDGEREDLSPEDLAALRAAGFPLLSELPSRVGSLIPQLHVSSTGWVFPSVQVPRELKDLLIAKGMVQESNSPACTRYGTDAGLCPAYWIERAADGQPHRKKRLFSSAAGWVRMWERPWKGVPDWTRLPLETRLERMRAGRSCNPGHCMAAFRQLEALPMAPLISMRVPPGNIKADLPELRSLFGSGITYGQAARKAAVLLDSPSKQDWELGWLILDYMFRIYHVDYIRANKGRAFWETDNETPAIDESKAEGISLSDRLRRAGIFENGSSYLPLVGDHMEDVFEALCRLSGTEAPAREFFQNTLLWYAPQWDDSFDAFIHYLVDEDHSQQDERAVLIEPLCLLDRIRTLEEKHSRLLEEIREQNKLLKKKLERMTTYVR